MLNNINKWVPLLGLLIAVVIGFPSMYIWGQSATETKCASTIEKLEIRYLHEREAKRKECEQKFTDLKVQQLQGIADIEKRHAQEIATLTHKFETCEKTNRAGIESVRDIFVAGHFADGLDMASNTSTGRTNWVTRLEDSIQIAYPGGAEWGVWFISVGAPTRKRAERSFIDASGYSKLELELKGKAGDKVVVALKDVDDPDDGTESRVYLTLRSNDWESYEVALAGFKTANLKKLYVVTSFVFAKQPQEFFVRKVHFK